MAVRDITTRYPGRCAVCGGSIAAGERARWDSAARALTCIGCALITTPVVPVAHAAPPAGVAGASVAAEHVRRQRADRHRQRAALPHVALAMTAVFLGMSGVALLWRLPALVGFGVVGALVVGASMTVGPSRWVASAARGAAGEQRVGALLERVVAVNGGAVLHDRTLPGRRENVDHLVITSAGVFTVETKNYSGALRVSGQRLFLGRYDKAAVLEQARRQAHGIERALLDAGATVPVRPIVCFAGTARPPHPMELAGVTVADPDGAARLLANAVGPLTGGRVLGVAQLLNTITQPALRN